MLDKRISWRIGQIGKIAIPSTVGYGQDMMNHFFKCKLVLALIIVTLWTTHAVASEGRQHLQFDLQRLFTMSLEELMEVSIDSAPSQHGLKPILRNCGDSLPACASEVTGARVFHNGMNRRTTNDESQASPTSILLDTVNYGRN